MAISLEPDYVSAHYNRGNTYLYLGRYQEALDDFNQALLLGGDGRRLGVGRCRVAEF